MGNTETKYTKPSETTTHSWEDASLSDLEIEPKFGGVITVADAKGAADLVINENVEELLSQIYIKINEESILGNKQVKIDLSSLMYEIMKDDKAFQYTCCFYINCVENISKKFPWQQHENYMKLIKEKLTDFKVSFIKSSYSYNGIKSVRYNYTFNISWS